MLTCVLDLEMYYASITLLKPIVYEKTYKVFFQSTALLICSSLLQDGAHYMIYTPSDPLLFVAAKVMFKINTLSAPPAN